MVLPAAGDAWSRSGRALAKEALLTNNNMATALRKHIREMSRRSTE